MPEAAIPRVTIGLPVYNVEAYLREAIDSVLGQTYSDLELVICDNASTDTTEQICREYVASDPRVHYHRNERNLGAAYNFGRVLELGRGEYFRWKGGDDVCAPHLVERCVEALDRNPGAILAYPKAAFIDASGHLMYHMDDAVSFPPWPRDPVARARQMFQAVFRDGRAANITVFGMARRAALTAVRPHGNYFAADRTLVAELSMQGEIVEVPEALAFYRRHAQSSSGYPAPVWKRMQQAFYDPRIQGWLRSELQFRRHYFEAYRAVMRSPLGGWQRSRLLASVSAVIVGHLLHAMGGRLGLVAPAVDRDAGEGAPHWTDLVSGGEGGSSHPQ